MSKGLAAKRVAEQLGFPSQLCVCAGDTLGDAPFLTDTSMRFICVGNASKQLKELCSSFDDGRCILAQRSASGALLEGVMRARAELDAAVEAGDRDGSFWLRWGEDDSSLKSLLDEAASRAGLSL